jgi:threonine/homoserine/homoserine lactone efflux protein
MNRQIWGMALFVLGALVIADGLAGFVQTHSGVMRWIYVGLGVLLVGRGLFVWWPFRKQNEN